MDGTEILAQRAKMKVVGLRSLASRRTGLDYEPLRLFKEIEKDDRCNELLKNSAIAGKNSEIVKYYNEHIRQSKLSAKDKKELII
ncbi:MAG: hypothetical protein HFJ35_06700 [Clostridia bacterium]|nr:hypothetical protein [Clostridia bacterium]